MTFDLSTLKTTGDMPPPRLLIYGPPGMGKTSLAAEFPNPIIIDVEQGVPVGVEIPTFGQIEHVDDVFRAIAALIKQDHDRETLIIDSLDRLEPLVWKELCERQGYDSIEDAGYGKGYIEALDTWQRLLNGLHQLRMKRNMNIILIAHSSIGKFDDPKTGSYSRFDSRLHRKANDLMQDDCDAILFINQDVAVVTEDEGFNKQSRRGEGGNVRWIYATGKPSHVAKNRYGMPDELVFKEGEGFAALVPYLPIEVAAEKEKKEA